jgi:hypothetical protein
MVDLVREAKKVVSNDSRHFFISARYIIMDTRE